MPDNLPNYQVAYLPYIECEQFQFGNIKLYPFYDNKTQELLKPEALEYLNWYFPKHIDWEGNKKQIVVIGLKEKLLGTWSNEEIDEILNSVAILCFLSVWDMQKFSAIAPDNFTLHFKNFQRLFEFKFLAVQTGSYISTNKVYVEEGAEKLRFVQPESVTSGNVVRSNPWTIDVDLLNGMSNTLLNAQNGDWFRRMVRAIKILNTSLQSSGNLSYFDRILLLVTATQTLFNKNPHSKKEFANLIVDCIGVRDKQNYSSDVNEKLISFTENLYTIRSKYTHGNEMKDSEMKNNTDGEYYQVGMYVFGLACKYILYENGYLTFQDRNFQSYFDSNIGLKERIKNSINNL
ncbi:MAG: hypothetical protein AAB071_02160 [Bacteroidota bacterium]